MPQTVVPAVVTPISEGAASTLLVGELTRALGKVPSREMATLVFALIWVESGRGRPMCHNMGNISAGPVYPTVWRPPWYDLETIQALPDGSERQKLLGLHAGMTANPPTVPKAFRAYGSDLEGMRDFVNQLVHTFPEVLRAAETGDASAFTAALHQKYSRDYSPEHAGTFVSFQKGFGERQLFAALPKADGSEAPDSPGRSQPVSPVSWPSVLERVRDVPIIRQGSSSFTVVCWKQFLNLAMGTKSPLSPDFDAGCDEATRAFQKAQGIKDDGIVGPMTWAKMFEVG